MRFPREMGCIPATVEDRLQRPIVHRALAKPPNRSFKARLHTMLQVRPHPACDWVEAMRFMPDLSKCILDHIISNIALAL
jgi:hypothetical protein